MNSNIKINRGVRTILRLVVERAGRNSMPGRKADKILTSGQGWMRRADLINFQRMLGA